MRKNQILTIFFAILIALYFVFNVFKLSIILDNDFGWHLKTGEYIKNYGIPQNDPFSYTMPSFPFVNHAWLTSLLVFELYSLESKFLLPTLFTLLAFLSVLLIVYPFWSKQNRVPKYLILILAILCLAAFAPYIGIRSQVASWLMFSILFVVLLNKKLFESYKILIPLLILVWVNIHGSFIAGIFILTIVIIVKTIKNKKVDKTNFLVLIGSFFATFINPYKERIWNEVWMQLSDGKLDERIVEWLPSFYFFNPSFLILLVLSALLMLKYQKKVSWEEKILYLILSSQAILTTRHVPIFSLFSLYLILKSLNFFAEEIKKIKYGLSRFKKASIYFSIIIFVILVLENFFWIDWLSKYSVSKFYPQEAVIYLKNNMPHGNIFSEYGWGGYLIWQYPEKKVFIDGRMPTWKWNNAPSKELSNAMDTYLKILRGEIDSKNIFTQFNIDTVLWSKSQNQKTKDSNLKKILKHIEDKFNKYYKFSLNYNFLEELQNEGWKVVYEDKTSVILKIQ